jgi:hypothetical protein
VLRYSTISGSNNFKTSTSVGAPKRRRHRGGLNHLNIEKAKEMTAIELESPTSVSMKNSFIIKNADPSFEAYYNSIRKKKSTAF